MPQNLMRKTLEGYFLDEVEIRCNPLKDNYVTTIYAPASELMLRRQKVACLDAVLVKERLRLLDKQAQFQERWEAAAQKMKGVDESILKFNDHYRDSNNQRDRYFKLVGRQNELKTAKMNENQRLQDEKDFLTEVLDQTSLRVERFKPVKEYLEKVRQASHGEFRTIRELLDRSNALTTTRAELMDRDDTARELVRKRERMLDSLLLIKANETVTLNNSIFELMSELDNLRAQQDALEEDLLHVKSTAASRAMELGKVRIAAYNLYLQVCRKMGRIARIPPNDSVKHLEYIQNSMREMNKLRKEVHHILKEAKRTALREKREAAQEALDAYRRGIRMPHTLRVGDMFGLFKIKLKDLDDIEDDLISVISNVPVPKK